VNEKVRKKSEPKLKINVVEIDISEAAPRRVFVKHFDPRQAKAWLLEQNVTARVATQDDIIEMVNEGVTPIGPFEAVDPEPADESQLDAFPAADRSQ
jgi:hypothetical protein